VRLRTPQIGRWVTLRDHLVERLGPVGSAGVDAMLAERRVVGLDGPIATDAAYEPGMYLWFHRDLPVEAPVPFEIGIVHRDERLLVVDKPHFLATIPRGRHVVETALVRLRRDLDLPDLSPAHRLDRATAGLLMFVVRRADRGAYQTLFRDRGVTKTYEAIAPHDPAVALPRTVRSRIVKERGVIRAYEVDGVPNAETTVELTEHRAGLGRYRLHPATGRTHQIRLHMNGLGVPIVGDDLYPVLQDRALDDYSTPLQLLAAELAFTDPLTGVAHRFTTRLQLAEWPSELVSDVGSSGSSRTKHRTTPGHRG
jgi:tRNA pseudouridine32 synthase/23S rRNA pseudouridine746 synthase